MEPERKIEKLLRAFAKKRKDQAGPPLELHSAMRRQLQAEVGRQGAAPERGGFFAGLLAFLRSGWAFGAGAVAIITVAVILPALTQSKSKQLAQAPASRSSANVRDAEFMEPMPKEADKKSDVISEDRLRDEGKLKAEAFKDQPATVPLETSVTTTPSREGNENKRARSFSAAVPEPMPGADGFSTNVTLAVTGDVQSKQRSDAEATALGGAETSLAMNQTYFFTNNAAISADGAVGLLAARTYGDDRVSGVVTNPAGVLAAFRVEQSNEVLRIVDRDGSIYSGEVQLEKNAVALNRQPGAPAQGGGGSAMSVLTGNTVAAPTAGEPVENYSFRVFGTNRSLNQSVVFTGNLFNITTQAYVNAPSAAAFGGGGAKPALSNAWIGGTAVIDGQKYFRIQAAPAKR